MSDGASPDRAWWKEAVIYQIYPKSFQDSNGDGVGDLQGIIDRLDYVADLGVDVIWLNPVYESPHVDNGYDISDYRAIHDRFGTMADWGALLSEIHDRDLRLIMDLVVNHTSTDHEWFQKSRRDEDGYREYYFWHEGEQRPNNWQSAFGGSAWEYDAEVGLQYLHLFDETQADLNWDTAAVREDVSDLMNWWLRKGIDGFRMDVINVISKPEGLPDGDPDSGWVGMDQFANGPKVMEYLDELAARTYDNYDAMTVGECSNVDPETASQYVGEDGPMDMLFHFEHMGVDSNEGWLSEPEWELTDLKETITRWQTDLDGWNSLYLTNHDQPRIVSRFGDEQYRRESGTLLATFLCTLSGTPYIYQGQEIGMTNYPWSSLDEFDDVDTIGTVEAAIEDGEIDGFEAVKDAVRARSRDNARTPMQWDDSEHAGFTDGDPWLPVNPDYEHINVAAAEADDESILHHYRELIALRKQYDTLVYGEYDLLLPDHEQLFAYTRTLGEGQLLIVLNWSGEPATFEPERINTVPDTILHSNYEGSPEDPVGERFRPYEAVVYRI